MPAGSGGLQGEVDRAAVYRAMAEGEHDEKLAAVYRRLAAVEAAHAELLAGRGGSAAPSLRARLLALVGAHAPSLAASAVAQASGGGAAGPASGDHQRQMARSVQTAASAVGGLPGDVLAQLEGRHRGGGGNALRAAVLGANDGLVSNLSLVMGVAGAAVAGRTILLTGLAGLVAGACSMAMGEWLSVNSAREMHQRQIGEAARELDAQPALEQAELAVIYQSKGLDETTAKGLAERLFRSRDAVLDTLAREELGVDPHELGGSAWAAAVSSFSLFAAGAFFPVIPFAVAGGWTAVVASLALSGAVLAAIGAATSRFTGRGVAVSAARQLGIGFAAALVTFGVGRLIGVSLGG
ncbi:MAG TPA: VIT1/CCC1 transporter family protein [Caulobacteraceae bacterium]|jgi:VIT1/CCC1 family predicted Fe2+/Mn2+ transporter